MKPIENFNRFVNESKESNKLAKEIEKSIMKIDDNMSYRDFAQAVGEILRDQYGSHNYLPFINELKKELGI
jgi:protein tyrosine/serine phosphatase